MEDLVRPLLECCPVKQQQQQVPCLAAIEDRTTRVSSPDSQGRQGARTPPAEAQYPQRPDRELSTAVALSTSTLPRTTDCGPVPYLLCKSHGLVQTFSDDLQAGHSQMMALDLPAKPRLPCCQYHMQPTLSLSSIAA